MLSCRKPAKPLPSKFLLDPVARRVGDLRTSTIRLVDVAGDVGFPDHLLQILCGVRRSEDRGTAGARPGSSRTSRSPRSPCSFTAGSEEGTCIEHRISISRAKHCRTISQSEAPTWDLALDRMVPMLSVRRATARAFWYSFSRPVSLLHR